MNPIAHLALSAAIGGGVWAATREINAVPAATAAGFLPDVDHFLDYYNWYVRRDRRRIIVFLHAWELAAAGALVYAFVVRDAWMLGVVLGYAGHVIADQVFNRGYLHGYSLLARSLLRFDAKRIHPGDQTYAYRHLLRTLPSFIRPPLQRWFESRVGPPLPARRHDSRGSLRCDATKRP